MHKMEKQILLRHPAYRLELQKSWDKSGNPQHAFIVYPTVRQATEEGISLLMGTGHDVPRRDMHYALYLFQRFHLNGAENAVACQG